MESTQNSNESSSIMDVEVPSFTIEGFLLSALDDFPAIDEDTKEKKEDTVNKYAALLRKEKLAGEKTLSTLTKDLLKNELGIPLGHAVAIAEAAQRYGKKLRRGASVVLEQQGKRVRTIVAENTGEGLSLFDPVKSLRLETCASILHQLEKQRVILVRSPPYSGKTSLASLMSNFVYEKGYKPVQVSVLRWNKKFKSLEDFFIAKTEQSWEELFDATQPTILLLDEAQTLYTLGQDHPFWKSVKDFKQQPVGQLCILFFATYGERPADSTASHTSTPITFEAHQTLDLGVLRFTENEFKEFLESYHATERGELVPISAEVRDVIYTATKGHAGLIRRFVMEIAKKFLEDSDKVEIQDEDIMAYLMSDDFSSIISRTRAVPSGTLVGAQKDLIERVINLETIKYPTNQIEINAAQGLIKAGILAAVDTNLEFSAPIIRTIFIQRIHGAPREKITSSDFPTFLVGCIQRLRPDTLKSSLSIGADKALLERQWQMEFYRVATTLLPEKAHISPDVGRVFKSEGFLDFYVNGKLQWAIELLREGYKSMEHSDRFEKGGLYYVMRKKIKHIAIIDFRAKDIAKSALQEHFWYVIYNSAFTHVTIKRLGHEDLVNLPLFG